MTKDKDRSDQLNIRCFYLRLLRRLWILPLAAAAGALIGWGIYHAVMAARPVHMEAKAELYLHFVQDVRGDQVYDYYNAYTWNDLIRSDQVQSLYAEQGGISDVAMTAELPSDIRVLWITATDEDQERAEQAAHAMAEALVSYGEINEVFRSIEIIGYEDAHRVTGRERQQVAAVTGAVLGLIAAFFGLLIAHLNDDAVYVPEEAAMRYGLPVVGIVAKEGSTEQDVPEALKEEVLLQAGQLPEGYAKEELLMVACGDAHGSWYAHQAAKGKQDQTLRGILLTDADLQFLKRYYRI